MISNARARRKSVLDSGAGAGLTVPVLEVAAQPPQDPVEETPVDGQALAEGSQGDLDDRLSDKVLTLLNRSTEDLAESPPQDALHGLTMSCQKQSSEAVATIVEWLHRRLQHDSVLVKHKTLVTFQVLGQVLTASIPIDISTAAVS